jgi:hypothetical protein
MGVVVKIEALILFLYIYIYIKIRVVVHPHPSCVLFVNLYNFIYLFITFSHSSVLLPAVYRMQLNFLGAKCRYTLFSMVK